MQNSDEQLVVDYLEGNEKSLDILIDRYVRPAYNFAFHLVKDRQVAEDITQDSFIKVWKYLRKYKQGSNFRTWIFTIIRNTAIDWLRQKKDLALSSFENEKGQNLIIETVAGSQPLIDELIAQAEDVNFIKKLLNELDPNYRNVLNLHYSEDYTFKEIGKLLKKPLHTVKSQHRRALVILRRLFSARAI